VVKVAESEGETAHIGGGAMSVLEEILRWAEDLPAWQSDAVARLLTKQSLTLDDLDDLLALLKAEHGIADPKNRTPVRLSPAQIPSPAQATEHVDLVAIKNLRNVNAIAENQRLAFCPDGLTVIYGDNGAGKSGYSRVLKRACRARDQAERIHPNACVAAATSCVAEADFEIAVNGNPREVHWTDGEVAPDELSSVAIFDSRCARAYLDHEDDFSYVPYGMDVFMNLAAACTQLKSMVENELAQSSIDSSAFAHLHGSTVAGELISSMSAKTNLDDVEVLASLSPEELARHGELTKGLLETSPKEKAEQLKLSARRIAKIATNASEMLSLVGKDAVLRLHDLADNYLAAQTAAAIAANHLMEGESLLPGTGGAAWTALFEAARKFAVESHPDKTFPDLGPTALCPLCQQPLSNAAERLQRFGQFIEQEVKKTLRAWEVKFATERGRLAGDAMDVGLDDATYAELATLDNELALDSRLFEDRLRGRRQLILVGMASGEWQGIDEQLESPAPRLRALERSLITKAETLEEAAEQKGRAALQRERDELDARLRLREVKDAVMAAVKKLRHRAKLEACLPPLRTTAISLKSSELAERVISSELADALNTEFRALDVGDLHVTLQSRADRGKALHKLRLELPQAKNPGEILSEGEQGAIAIGSLLAEVGLGEGRPGIVFDDPVSSLDHRRRERVARRLTAEAGRRQVIVLTHDIYFLCVLLQEAERAGVPCVTQSVVRQGQGCGVPHPELPFEGKGTAARVRFLRDQQRLIAKLQRNGDEQECHRLTVEAYQHLRWAWERAVEEVLLRNVVLRFRRGVETQRLAEVWVDDSDYTKVDSGMSKCSNYAHDGAPECGMAFPSPSELLADIEALEAWRMEVECRSGHTRKRRKSRTPLGEMHES
jgi:energy-coupling factor transporter ATP-binding protein EcfA2